MRTTTKWTLGSAIALVLGVTPLAMASGEGSTAKLGARNPSGGEQRSLTRETEIIANTNTYGTRQSNKSNNGGGAIYGCRSALGGSVAGNEPCVRSSNLANGNAFEFSTGGPLGGTITANGGDNAKPFTTNATGVATGLNADRVDSKSAEDISGDAVKAVTAGIRVATVAANGTLGAARGVTTATAVDGSAGTYRVVFAEDASSCVFNAVESDTSDTGAGPVAVSLGEDKKTATVRTRDGGSTGAFGAHGFHLTATCL